MFNYRYSGLALAITALIIGCTSTPNESLGVKNLDADYEVLASRQDVNEFAPIALKEARDSIEAVFLKRRNRDQKQFFNSVDRIFYC